MRIAAITAHNEDRRYTVTFQSIRGPLTAVYGPAHSGKSGAADLVGHALFGKHRVATAGHRAADGELIVEDRGGRYRVRCVHDVSGHTRLTIAAVDGSPVDQHTIRKMVGGLTPSILGPLCSVSFRETPDATQLLSHSFASGFQAIAGEHSVHATRRVSELAARRDLLAQELETRLATDRRASKDLESRWRELDRLVRDEQQRCSAVEQRLKAVEHSLAETDARLRYRRLELNVELRWQTNETPDTERPAALEAQVTRCRQILAELNERESALRAQLAQTQTTRPNAVAVLVEQQTWLAISRQLAADLSGEVARLARASASHTCVCHDAHPRLRPISETIERQLAVLEKSVSEQQRAANAAELSIEVDHLARAQGEMRRHLEHLLDRSQDQLRGTALARQNECGVTTVFSAADAEQLESRRLELEQDRFRLVDEVNTAARRLKVLRAERDAVERERSALLSARSIEHVQRELAHVQKKLEEAGVTSTHGEGSIADECLMWASDFLAQLTNGEIRRLMLFNEGRNAVVVDQRGDSVAMDSLTGAQRDQVYLSLCFALLTAASRQGVWLPLVLDDPFERLDARATAALATILESFGRHGHQVVVFTQQKDAADRLAAVGAEMYDMLDVRRSPNAGAPINGRPATPVSVVRAEPMKNQRIDDATGELRRRKKKRLPATRNGEVRDSGHSDAA
jgi:DNA repair exonuclease SbcCD ATPase subunit